MASRVRVGQGRRQRRPRAQDALMAVMMRKKWPDWPDQRYESLSTLIDRERGAPDGGDGLDDQRLTVQRVFSQQHGAPAHDRPCGRRCLSRRRKSGVPPPSGCPAQPVQDSRRQQCLSRTLTDVDGNVSAQLLKQNTTHGVNKLRAATQSSSPPSRTEQDREHKNECGAASPDG